MSDWRERSACRAVDPELFFPVGEGPACADQIAAAKAVCAGCPVVGQCLAQAVDSGEDYGIWGGLTPSERRGARIDAVPDAVPAGGESGEGRGTTWVGLMPASDGAADLVAGVGTWRRVRALAADGWTTEALGAWLGVSAGVVARYGRPHRAGQYTRVSVVVATAVAGLYAQLAGRRGPSEQSAALAYRRGWAPPAAWTEDTIDDPDAVPDWDPVADPLVIERAMVGVRPGRPLTRAEVVEVVRQLAGAGHGDQEIADRLRWQRTRVQALRTRWQIPAGARTREAVA